MANTEILARFDVDDDAIITKIANNKKQIAELKAANKAYIDEYTKGLKAAEKAIAAEEASQAKLNEELKAGNISRDVYNQLIDDSNKQIQKAQIQVATLSAEYDTNARAIAINEERIKALSTENRGLSTSYQAVIYAQNGLLENYTNEGKSVQELREDNLKLIKVRNQIALATDGETEELKKLNAIIDENTKKIAENVSQDEKRIMNIGNYKDAIIDAFSAIKSGDLSGGIAQIRELGNGATGALKSLTQQAIAFIATPIGAAIAGLAAIGGLAKYTFDFNEGLKESNLQLRSLGVSSKDISKVRTEIQATADTFGKDFEELAAKANSLAKTYDISMSEANALIREGLATGGAQNEEFLDSLGEYDVFFEKAGFSAKEFINIINEGNSLGIYADKLPDAIKEAGLALEEQTQTTRDALVNAFGASFTDDILKKVKTGEITTKDALTAISAEAEKANLNQQQLAQLTADVFKGAGEDVGGALGVLKALSGAAKTELDDVAKAQLNLANANEEFNKAQARLFEIEGFGSVWANIKTEALSFFSKVLNGFADFKEAAQPVIDIIAIVLKNAWESTKTTIGVVFDFIVGGFELIGNGVKTFINVVKALAKGDLKGALNAFKDGFLSVFNIIGNTFNKLKNTIIDGVLGIVDNISPVLSALGVDVDKLTKKLESFKSKIPESKKVSIVAEDAQASTKEKTADTKTPEQLASEKKALEEAKKKIAEAQKELEEATKKGVELLQQYAAEQQKLAASELNNYILNNASKLANEKVFTQALIDEEKNRLETIAAERKKLLDAEYAEKQNAILREIEEERKKNATLTGLALENSNQLLENKQVELQILQSEYYGKDLELKQNTEKEKAAVDKLYTGQIIEQKQLAQSLEYQQRLLDLQEQGASEYAIKEEQLTQQYALELEKYLQDIEDKFNIKIEKDQAQYDIEQEIQLAREEIEAEIAATKDANKLAMLNNNLAQINQLEQKYAKEKAAIQTLSEQQRLNAVSTTLSNIQGLFGEHTAAFKAIAIAQTTIDTYKSAVSAYAAGLQIGGPAGLIAAPVAAAAAVASGLATVAKIVGVKFAKGGVAVGPSHAEGGIPAVVDGQTPVEIEGGEAIINKKSTAKYRSLLSAINTDQGGVAFASGGIPGGAALTALKNESDSILNPEVLAEVVGAAVKEGAAIGTESGSQKGIGDYNTNLNIEQNANF